MPAQVNAVVSGDESDVHDEPHIRDRRVTVRHVHARVEERGVRPETVADQFDLPLSSVYHALAYYHDNPEEMRAVEDRRERVRAEAADDTRVATGPEDAPSEP